MSHVIYRRNIKTRSGLIMFMATAKIYGYCQESLIGSLADKLQEATHA